MLVDERLPERFWAKVQVSAAGCWDWTANLNPSGYGFYRHVGMALAHRVAYAVLVGPVPPGLQLDHLCRNRRCVNPEHLEPVTPAENNRRGESPSSLNARKTHCVRGHAFTPENTRIDSGGRRCKACKNANARKRYAARREGMVA